MQDFDYRYLADALDKEGNVPSIRSEASMAIVKMSREISRLQSLVYLKPSAVKSCGRYRMFRTDDSDNVDGLLCDILQSADNNFYLIVAAETPSKVECQNILTLDEEVRLQKVD